MITVTELNRFPVKSCRGQSLATASIEPWGLAGDRRWMIVDPSGETITARDRPRMVLVRPELTECGLLLQGPDADPLLVPIPDASDQVAVSVHGKALSASLASADAAAWFSAVVGEPARLVYLDDPTRRATNPAFTLATDRVEVGFADAYPLLLANEASLVALNDWIIEGPRADEGPLPMRRFRPSLVVRGAAAWVEDGWRRLRVGSAIFRVVKGCDRCVLTTVDPETAAKGKEPITTLARYRRWDGKTWFGMNLVPDTPGVAIHVGDEVEVLEAVEAPNGPLR